MKNERSATKEMTMKDIERAAWFARLALGDCRGIEQISPTKPSKTSAVFHVIP